MVPMEYLHEQQVPGLPPHKLSLHVGAPVTLAQLVESAGLDPTIRPGTFLKISHVLKSQVTGRVTGVHARIVARDHDFVILRPSKMSPTNKLYAFSWTRTQLPLLPGHVALPGKYTGLHSIDDVLFRDVSYLPVVRVQTAMRGRFARHAFIAAKARTTLVRQALDLATPLRHLSDADLLQLCTTKHDPIMVANFTTCDAHTMIIPCIKHKSIRATSIRHQLAPDALRNLQIVLAAERANTRGVLLGVLLNTSVLSGGLPLQRALCDLCVLFVSCNSDLLRLLSGGWFRDHQQVNCFRINQSLFRWYDDIENKTRCSDPRWLHYRTVARYAWWHHAASVLLNARHGLFLPRPLGIRSRKSKRTVWQRHAALTSSWFRGLFNPLLKPNSLFELLEDNPTIEAKVLVALNNRARLNTLNA